MGAVVTLAMLTKIPNKKFNDKSGLILQRLNVRVANPSDASVLEPNARRIWVNKTGRRYAERRRTKMILNSSKTCETASWKNQAPRWPFNGASRSNTLASHVSDRAHPSRYAAPESFMAAS